jgi:ABC-type transport system substrate-binding protein
VLIIGDTSTRQAAFRTGAVNSLAGVDPNMAKPLLEELGDLINYVEYLPEGSMNIGFRVDLPESPFYHKEVRQAFMLAIDQPLIRDQYWGGKAELVGWPVTGNKTYSTAHMDETELPADVAALYSRDLAAAQALMDASPYPDGFDCSIIIWDRDIYVDVLSLVQSMVDDIGIDMAIDIVDYSVYTSRARARNHTAYELIYTTVSGNGTFMKMINMRGTGSYNISHINEDFSVPEIEAVYADMMPYVGIDEAAMMDIHKQFMPWLLEQAYVVNMPTTYLTQMWWPWLKNYYGCSNPGYYNSYGATKYVWLDEDLKESMGY